MKERQYDAYDIISIGRDTRKNLEDNKHLLAPFEMVISTDTNDLLYKDEQGNLGGFFGSSGDINDQIKGQVDANTIGISTNSEAISNLTSSVGGKLDKGGYDGTAKTLDSKIDSAKVELDGKIDTKLTKGNFNGTADELIPYNEGWKTIVKSDFQLGIDFDDIIESGKYSLRGNYNNNAINAPSQDQTLVNVWNYGGYIYQEANSYYTPEKWVRTFKRDVKNATWDKFLNTANCPISKSANGYCKLANGMIMQWGEASAPSGGKFTINFPISFSSRHYTLSGNVIGRGVNDSVDYIYTFVTSSGHKYQNRWENCSVAYRRTDNTFASGGVSDPVNWIAIGY